MPFVRTMSMEQRWQDLANLLSLPGQEGVGMHYPFAHHSHHHHHTNYSGHNYSHDGRGVVLHNATLAPPVGDLNSSGPYNNTAMGKWHAHVLKLYETYFSQLLKGDESQTKVRYSYADSKGLLKNIRNYYLLISTPASIN